MTEITPALGLPAYFLGRRIAGQRKRVPVAYLYNGVRLPSLPEWDRTAYPYALVWERPGWGMYLLCYKDKPVVGEATGNFAGTDRIYSPTATKYLYYQVRSDLTEWVFLRESSAAAGSGTAFANGYTLIWSEFDVMRDDGETIYLAASDPIPVYE